jgi:hypothetical protein
VSHCCVVDVVLHLRRVASNGTVWCCSHSYLCSFFFLPVFKSMVRMLCVFQKKISKIFMA